jgi:hypothetical protein
VRPHCNAQAARLLAAGGPDPHDRGGVLGGTRIRTRADRGDTVVDRVAIDTDVDRVADSDSISREDDMRIIYSTLGGHPYAVPATRANTEAMKGGAGNWFGAFSIQSFVDQNSLSQTHADADGWYSYLGRFNTGNFHLEDSGVVVWEFIEGGGDWDDWQDTYGLDSCKSIYYSGHGGMDGNGVFSIPLGADWSTRGHWASSDKMVIGDDHTRYMFWSTCLSLRVLDGMDPIKTWGGPDRGFRMLFGFETTSVDSGDYGSNFWTEWNKGKSFTQAWLDASWDISHTQAPSVVACGTNAGESGARLDSERLLYSDAVSTNWFSWRWYYASSSTPARSANLALPQELLVADLVPFELTPQHVSGLAERFQLDGDLPSEVAATASGAAAIPIGDHSIGIGGHGEYEVALATPNRDNRTEIPAQRAVQIAQAALEHYELLRDADLVFDRIRLTFEGGGSNTGTATREEPRVVESTVQFRQVINGLPVITPGAGAAQISIDNDGIVTSVRSSLRQIDQLSANPRQILAGPPSGRTAPSPSDVGHEQLLAQAWSDHLRIVAASGGRLPSEVTTIPDTTEVGYEIEGNTAYLGARRVVETSFGQGCRKQHQLFATIVR